MLLISSIVDFFWSVPRIIRLFLWLIFFSFLFSFHPAHAANNRLAHLYPLLFTGKVSFSGSIDIASGITVDNDVNDPAGQNGPRNDPGPTDDPGTTWPQQVSSPVTIAGYVNRAGEGAYGASFTNGDYDDYFRVELTGGQKVTLIIGDQTAGDLDLYLYDGSGTTIVDASLGVDKTEQLIVPADGTYVLDVYAYSGYSTYTLVIGQDTGATGTGYLTLTHDFVVGEAVVHLKEQVVKTAGKRAAVDIAGRLGMRTKAGVPMRSMLWSFDPGRPVEKIMKNRAGADEAGLRSKKAAVVPELREKWDTLMAIKQLRLEADIRFADPNFIIQPTFVPNDTFYPFQWHYPLINLPAAWDITTGSPPSGQILVAVIDTGVLLSHPDLQGQLAAGYDFISDPLKALDGDGIDPNPDDPGDQGVVGGSSFHGTHVAGTIAAASNNGSGVTGVSWGARIMPLRVLGKDGGTIYDVVQGCLFAAGLANDSGTVPVVRADVINMSLGGNGHSSSFQDALTQVRQAGVIIVAAAGNANSDVPEYPASYEGVVSVSAVDMDKERAPYSNYGITVDVAAPGGDVTVDRNGDGYVDGILSTGGNDSRGTVQMVYPFMQGTSMAAPHVAGVVALMEAATRSAPAGHDLTPDQLDSLLASGTITEDIGNPGRDNLFGWGLIDAYRAVLEARQQSVSTPVLSVTPASMNFGAGEVRLVLSVNNRGGGTLTISEVSDDADWLQVEGSGLGAYSVSVNRTGLAEGTYNAVITVDSNAGRKTVPVIMNVQSSSEVSPNAGYHYVLLIDVDEQDVYSQVREQYNVAAREGVYPYYLSNVRRGGHYLVVAGTDFDNDGYICDAGEACGAYLTLDQPVVLEAAANRSRVNFTTSFQTQFVLSAFTGSTSAFKGWPLSGKIPVKREEP